MDVLGQDIEATLINLYWPSPPYEGPVKLRFACAECGYEGLLLDPFPNVWSDLLGLEGECFQCGGTRKVKAKFLEAAKERESILEFSGTDKSILARYLTNLMRSGPPTHPDIEGLPPELASFEVTVRPPNWRGTKASPEEGGSYTPPLRHRGLLGIIEDKIDREGKGLPHDFLWSDEEKMLSLKEKRKLFLQAARKFIYTREKLRISMKRSDVILRTVRAFDNATPRQLTGSSIRVKFDGEAGVDYGGVTREFFQIASERMIDPQACLFAPIGPNHTFHPSPAAKLVQDAHLKYFQTYGRLLGKALLNDKRVVAPLTRAVFKLLLGRPLHFEDLQTVDKQTYKQLRRCLEFDEDTLEDCCLVFAVTVDDFGSKTTHSLVEHGEDIEVCKSNLLEWMQLLAGWKMIESVREELVAMLGGFYEVVPIQLLQIFNAYELEQMLCGMKEIDLEDWRTHTVAVGFNTPDRKELLEWFWMVMEELPPERRGQVLQFATGSGQVPLSFEHLFPPFTIALQRSLSDDRLPCGHTCFNRLDLPHYTTKETLRKQILTALDFGLVGFDLR